MGLEYRNVPWFASTNTTAAGVAIERSQAPTTDMQGRQDRRFRLRGFAISGSTSVAISTSPIKVIYGDSSIAPQTTAELCNDPGSGMVGVSGIMGIEGGYIALETTVAHADGGLTFVMWGD